jgi:hypothetical protein
MAGAGIVFLAGGAAIVFWLVSFGLDRQRIAAYVEDHGGRIVSITWAPFGKGWFGEKNDRIFEVVYYDNGGNQHFATCKTSLWSGVYWTEDRVTHRKSGWFDSLAPGNEPGHPLIGQLPRAPQELDDELQQLRQENAELRAALTDRDKHQP